MTAGKDRLAQFKNRICFAINTQSGSSILEMVHLKCLGYQSFGLARVYSISCIYVYCLCVCMLCVDVCMHVHLCMYNMCVFFPVCL